MIKNDLITPLRSAVTAEQSFSAPSFIGFRSKLYHSPPGIKPNVLVGLVHGNLGVRVTDMGENENQSRRWLELECLGREILEASHSVSTKLEILVGKGYRFVSGEYSRKMIGYEVRLKSGKSALVWPLSFDIIVNGKKQTLSVPTRMYRGRLMLPAGDIARLGVLK